MDSATGGEGNAAGLSFDRIADRYEETRGGVERGVRYVPTMLPFIDMSRPVLEVGVGTGAVASPLAEAGLDVVGLDLSPEMLRVAAGRLDSLVCGDGSRLPFAPGAFGTVVAVWAVHVIGDTQRLAGEVARVLSTGGRFLVVSSTPDQDGTDVTDIAYGLARDLGRGWDRSAELAEVLRPAGLMWEGDHRLEPWEDSLSPAAAIEGIEQRIWSMLWDLDQPTWDAVVEPVAARLRALPEQDRGRPRHQWHVLSVYRSADG
ncbi:class I SAM-dependent methyltransferase [Euzebya tangerina]|uniref:class I SAM-dependent methyltransferase n=1 Tax=Euzebya tangerina TaxID=591198 RepID=UPI0013C3755F|nr:class I SAM-dependent methyltransferase [Euzebya tangerina]